MKSDARVRLDRLIVLRVGTELRVVRLALDERSAKCPRELSRDHRDAVPPRRRVPICLFVKISV